MHARFHFLLLAGLILIINLAGPSSGRAQRDVVRRGEPRIALVIGNGDYALAPLKNPVHDAEAMALALERCGFEVIKMLNVGLYDMEAGVRRFESKLGKNGVGLFFFAGHGMQINGRNFLVPVGALVKAKKEYDVPFQCLDVGYVMAAMEQARNRLNIIILDACRNNPFRSFRGAGNGLAEMKAPAGSLLAYATAPGRTANDGPGDNGLYTSMLLKHLETPGLSVEGVFKKVRVDVQEASRGAQVPWESTSLTGEFYFVPASGSQAPTVPPAPPVPRVNFDDLKPDKSDSYYHWMEWQAGMERAWDQASDVDRDPKTSPGGKMEAWNRVLGAFEKDNPLTDRDEELREKAKKRIEYWRSQPKTPPAPAVESYRVVGVESWDVLWIRSRPDPNSVKVGSIPPQGENVIYLGETQYYKTSPWFKIRYRNTVGWVNSRFLARSE